MDFMKMHGLGNDFVVVAGDVDVLPTDVAAWCERRRGIGADGVLRVTGGGAAQVRMEYWNADGSPAEMCGNGLRCVARYARDLGLATGDAFTVDTPAGPRQVEVLADGSARAQLGTPEDSPVAPFEVAGYHVQPISMGNPHAVIVVDDCYATPVDAVGPIVQSDPRFPDGTNVEFLTISSRERLALRVWERGVGETLACGTGAAAATAVAQRRGLAKPRVTVELLGGPLVVETADDGSVWIEGPAEYSFRGTLP